MVPTLPNGSFNGSGFTGTEPDLLLTGGECGVRE